MKVSTAGLRAIVLDIEGTTTPVSFVYDVLFPFARVHAAEFLGSHWGSDACRAAVAQLESERAADADFNPRPTAPQRDDRETRDRAQDDVVAYVNFLMDRDRKSPGLKALQGLIWREGYRAGDLHGQVYPDVPPALERWRASGLGVSIYSSGSVLAQQLLFQTTDAGDLTLLLNGHYDTGVGPKTSATSYTKIVESLRVAPDAVLFVSDVIAELDAARQAGLRTALCVREGSSSSPVTDHAIISTFDDIVG